MKFRNRVLSSLDLIYDFIGGQGQKSTDVVQLSDGVQLVHDVSRESEYARFLKGAPRGHNWINWETTLNFPAPGVGFGYAVVTQASINALLGDEIVNDDLMDIWWRGFSMYGTGSWSSFHLWRSIPVKDVLGASGDAYELLAQHSSSTQVEAGGDYGPTTATLQPTNPIIPIPWDTYFRWRINAGAISDITVGLLFQLTRRDASPRGAA